MLIYLPTLLISLLLSFEQPKAAVTTVKPDVCRVYGRVFFDTGQPRDRGIPYFLVYNEKNDAFADVIVFKEDNRLFADGPGLWFEVKERGQADFIVYLTDRRGLADFSIHYTDARSYARCNK